MKQSICLFFILLTYPASSQDIPDIKVNSGNFEWHNNQVNISDAYVLESHASFSNYHVDPDHHMVYLFMHKGTDKKPSENGKMVAYDISHEKVRWTFPLNLKREYFMLIDSVPIVCKNGFSKGLDWQSGEEIWSRRGEIMLASNSGKDAIGFYPVYKSQASLFSVNIHTGEDVWQHKTTRQIDLERTFLLGDTSLVCISNGFEYLNFKTGTGFFHSQDMGKNANPASTSSLIVAGILGGMMGVLILRSVIPPGNHRPPSVGNLQSVYTYHDQHFYSIHEKYVRKYDLEGNIIWSAACILFTGVPKLFVHLGSLFVVQDGMNISSDGYAVYGSAAISKLDLKNGNIERRQILNGEKGERLKDYLLRDSSIVLSLESAIVERDLHTFEVIKENHLGEGKKLGLDKIINPPAFVRETSFIRNMSRLRPGHFFATNTSNLKIEFDDDLNMIGVIQKDKFYEVRSIIDDDMLCIENEKEVFFIDLDGNQRGEFTFSPAMQVRKRYVVDRIENRILVCPMPE